MSFSLNVKETEIMDSLHYQTQQESYHLEKIIKAVSDQHKALREMRDEMRKSLEIWKVKQENAEVCLSLVTNQILLKKGISRKGKSGGSQKKKKLRHFRYCVRENAALASKKGIERMHQWWIYNEVDCSKYSKGICNKCTMIQLIDYFHKANNKYGFQTFLNSILRDDFLVLYCKYYVPNKYKEIERNNCCNILYNNISFENKITSQKHI